MITLGLRFWTSSVLANAGKSAWDRLPIIVSAIVALIGVYMGWQARVDAKKKDEAKKLLDTLTIGQEWVVQALELAKADNVQLRATLVEQQREHESTIRGWQEKVEHQEDEITALKTENAKLVSSCATLTAKTERLERELEALKRRLEIT